MPRRAVAHAGKVVAVTGGARGIGRAIAGALVHAGANVGIGDLDAELCTAVAHELGPRCRGHPLDVTNPDSFAAFLDAVERGTGALDALVNNAGVMPLGRFTDEPLQAADRAVDVNLRGTITGTQLALARMLPRGRGHIVNIASSAGCVGLPGGAVYSATKAGVIGLSDALRGELAGTGIHVTCVMPATVRTELAAGVTPRGIRPVGPEAVAAAVSRALARPRPEVYVPAPVGPALRLMRLAGPSGRSLLMRAFGADRAFLTADAEARAAYAARCARQRTGDDSATEIALGVAAPRTGRKGP